jgi:hypothetical protein
MLEGKNYFLLPGGLEIILFNRNMSIIVLINKRGMQHERKLAIIIECNVLYFLIYKYLRLNYFIY